MVRIMRAALTGLGAFVSELVPAQAITESERALLSGVPLQQGLDEFAAGERVSSDWLFDPGCDGKCARDECVCPDPAAPDTAAPSPELPAGDTEPAGANPPVTPAGSTSELTAADLDRAAAIVRGHVVLVPDLSDQRYGDYYTLADRLNTAADAIRTQK